MFNHIKLAKKPNDEVLHESPSGQSTQLVIHYYISK